MTHILLSLGGINVKDNSDFDYLREVSEINHLGIYFSRHGYLHTIKIGNLIAPGSLSEFVKWFIKSACSTREEIFDYCSNFMGQPSKELLDELKSD